MIDHAKRIANLDAENERINRAECSFKVFMWSVCIIGWAVVIGYLQGMIK